MDTKNFDKWSEEVQWAVCAVATLVPSNQFDPQAELRIQWGGYTIEDGEIFFDRLMVAMRERAERVAAQMVLDHFKKTLDVYDDIFGGVEKMLKDELKKKLHVRLDDYGELV